MITGPPSRIASKKEIEILNAMLECNYDATIVASNLINLALSSLTFFICDSIHSFKEKYFDHFVTLIKSCIHVICFIILIIFCSVQ